MISLYYRIIILQGAFQFLKLFGNPDAMLAYCKSSVSLLLCEFFILLFIFHNPVNVWNFCVQFRILYGNHHLSKDQFYLTYLSYLLKFIVAINEKICDGVWIILSFFFCFQNSKLLENDSVGFSWKTYQGIVQLRLMLFIFV
jgi:hypothetical protein